MSPLSDPKGASIPVGSPRDDQRGTAVRQVGRRKGRGPRLAEGPWRVLVPAAAFLEARRTRRRSSDGSSHAPPSATRESQPSQQSDVHSSPRARRRLPAGFLPRRAEPRVVHPPVRVRISKTLVLLRQIPRGLPSGVLDRRVGTGRQQVIHDNTYERKLRYPTPHAAGCRHCRLAPSRQHRPPAGLPRRTHRQWKLPRCAHSRCGLLRVCGDDRWGGRLLPWIRGARGGDGDQRGGGASEMREDRCEVAGWRTVVAIPGTHPYPSG